MNILVIGSDRALFESGAPVRSRLLAQAALVDQMDVVVFTKRAPQFTTSRLSDQLTIHPTRSQSVLHYLLDAYRIARTIVRASGNSNWIISAQDPFESGAIAYLVAQGLHLPLHLQLHTDPFSREWMTERIAHRFRYVLGCYLLKRAHGIRVVSRRIEQQLYALGIPPERVSRVPIYTDVKHFIEAAPSVDLRRAYPRARHIMLSLGRLTHEKNYHGLLRAFRDVLETAPETLLLIVGEGPEYSRLLAYAQSLGVAEWFRILPWTRDTVSYYKSADIYVQPSLYEGWGLAVIEAMASGIPVVMTDTGCAGEVLEDNRTGLVVPPNNDRVLAGALQRLLGDATLRVRLATAAQKRVQTLLSHEETLARYKESWERTRAAYSQQMRTNCD